MKKSIIGAICGLLISGVAAANDMGFYVGVNDVGYNKFSYTSDYKNNLHVGDTIKTKAPSAALVVGIRPNCCDNFGVEVGYTFFKKIKITDNTNTYHLKTNDIHMDLIGYMPIDKSFEVLGSFGIGRLHQKDTDPTINAKDTSGTIRVGAGIRYNIDEHFATNLTVRYQKVGTKNEWIQHSTSIGLGLTYTI